MLRQYERVPRAYVLDEAGVPSPNPTVRLRSTDSSLEESMSFSFEAVRANVFRTTFSSAKHPLPPYPSAAGMSTYFGAAHQPKVTTDPARSTREFVIGPVRAVVEWSDAPVVSLFMDGVQKPLHRDLHFRSYALDATGIAHYSAYKKDSLHVGLGEKAAPMDLSGRGFSISASDTFGYDAYRTDPLYKHIPLLINVTPQGCVAIFSTSHARGSWAVGSEIDGMWGHFKVYRQAHGGLEEYLIVGKTVAEVVRTYAHLVGFPLLMPRYMMGYVSGGMKYSMEDTPRAADAILDFVHNCAKHDIPVSAFQMSSGYTVAEVEPKTRNVFTWNRHRFPDPRAFTRECHRLGVRLLANVKPYVLDNHPEYARLARDGAFFTDPVTKSVAVARLWSAGGGESGEGSHIDFTSRAGYDWWFDGVKALKEVGIDAIWNDNNEYNIPSDDWQCALQTVDVPDVVKASARKDVGLWGRAMHTELMARASAEACEDVEKDVRPLVLTRSATAGTMRHAASSWSGDNVTSWEGMKGGNALALNAGFSLLQSYGHDIGGFEGPQPTPEHLVRWIQLGIHSPRFAINCFKTSAADNLIGEVIEPWMFPSVTPLIRAAIKRRYELVPYTYSLAIASHRTAVPPQRWTGWGYESDPNVWTDHTVKAGDTQYWFGDALLVGGKGIYEPGEDMARVYLPLAEDKSDLGFLNTNAPFQHLPAGRWHTISSTWHTSIPVLARVGSAIPVGKPVHTTTGVEGDAHDKEFPSEQLDDWRGLEIFPPPLHLSGGPQVLHRHFQDTWQEDDGFGVADREPENLWIWHVKYSVDSDRIKVVVAGTLPEVCLGRRVANASDDGVDSSSSSVRSEECDTCKSGLAPSWFPKWLPSGIDIIVPVGEEREVVGWDDLTSHNMGRDARGRHVWHITPKVVLQGEWAQLGQ